MAYSGTEYTYGTMIQNIARMVGHPVPSDAAGSTDTAVIQMGVAVNQALLELLAMYNWQDLTVLATINVLRDSANQAEKSYSLPSDFYKFINQTQWDSTSDLPAIGPIDETRWMTYRVRNTGVVTSLKWQLRGDYIYFQYPPATTHVFEYAYISKGMVIDADVLTTTKNFANKNGDTFVLDPNLILLLARAKYREWKGFDASAATRDFLIAYSNRIAADKAAPVLSLNTPIGEPLLNGFTSVPDTGYGS
jgi:hypothetical protein